MHLEGKCLDCISMRIKYGHISAIELGPDTELE